MRQLNHRRRNLSLLALLCIAIPITAQTPTTPAFTFEVSTIKPAQPGPSYINWGEERLVARNIAVGFLMTTAYNLNSGSNDQLINPPAWLKTDHFDITAKADTDTAAKIHQLPSDQRDDAERALIQSLLADRFQLRLHHETREFTVNAIVPAKGGVKLTPAVPRDQSPNPSNDPTAPTALNNWQGIRTVGAGQIVGHSTTLEMLVHILAGQPELYGRMTINQTGLTNKYDFTLNWSPENSTTDTVGPSLFTALQQQLGLKIEVTKAPINVLVIDHIEQPSGN